MRRLTLPLLAVAAGSTLCPLTAQQADTTLAADSLAVSAFSWVSRLVPIMQDAPKPYRLYLPWDEWGHSDLAATAANPFITADLQVGAACLDGSLGQPILSAVIPSAVMERSGPADQARFGYAQNSATDPPPDIPTFSIAPLQDLARANQTYFFWDQGDYSYQDVQVGGSAQLDESRNIMIAGQTRSHPGQYGLAGPSSSPTRYKGSVLQNYLLDYQRRIRPSMDFNYTLLHQREQVGLPFDRYTADRRRNHTWTHGFRLEKTFTSWTIRLYGATMVSDLSTITDTTIIDTTTGLGQVIQISRMSRRSSSLWGGGELIHRLSAQWQLLGKWQSKQRHIADQVLGSQSLDRYDGRLIAGWNSGKWKLSGGFALVDGRLEPEARLVIGSVDRSITLGTEGTSFLDFPHYGRRITQDTTEWLRDPVSLRSTTLAFQALLGTRGRISARLALLSTSDRRTATTSGAALDWTPWKDALRLRGAFTAVSSPDTALFPTRICATAGLTFTLPGDLLNRILKRRARARPFVSANASLISNQFAQWLDPRFADITPYLNPAGGTISATSWISGEAGIKVADFELRFSIYNATGSTIQNSPLYLPHSPLRHYSLSWRFYP